MFPKTLPRPDDLFAHGSRRGCARNATLRRRAIHVEHLK
jgi:hypothetical protein